MNDTILDVLLTERPRLTRSIQRRFAWSSPQTIDDAVSDAIASALIRPAPYERALAKDGRKGVKRMLYKSPASDIDTRYPGRAQRQTVQR